MTEGFRRRSSTERDIQPVAIHALNLQNREATVFTRVGTEIVVDCRFSTGDTTVVPAIGEQWYIERFDDVWRLYGRIPFNDPTMMTEAVEGQVGVGSGRGPVELHGSVVNVHGPMMLASYVTAARPSAVDLGPGATIYDSTLGIPVFSNGTEWINAMGDTV